MRRQAAVVLCTTFAVLLVAGAAGAQTPSVRVALGSSFISGEGWGDAKDVKATLRDSAGSVKGVCWTRTYSGGYFDCSWGEGILLASVVPPATNEPGDKLSVEHEGSVYASGTLPGVRLTGLDPATDRVGGRIVPRRKRVRVHVYPEGRLTSTGFVRRAPYAQSGATAADGSFAVDVTAGLNAMRNDRVFVGASQGRFEIGVWAAFPGLYLEKDTPVGYLSGIPSTAHTVRLYGPRDVLKGTATVTLGTAGMGASDASSRERLFPGGSGLLVFKDGAGRPVRILQGDTVAVGGPQAFRFRVPKLAPSITASRFAVRTLPNRPVSFSSRIFNGPAAMSTYFSGAGSTDGAGYFQYAPAAAITPYSTCAFTIVVDGNVVTASRTLTP